MLRQDLSSPIQFNKGSRGALYQRDRSYRNDIDVAEGRQNERSRGSILDRVYSCGDWRLHDRVLFIHLSEGGRMGIGNPLRLLPYRLGDDFMVFRPETN